jgi:hypothetical protein
LVVADGVSGWRKRNIDPKLYTQELCDNVVNYFTQCELTKSLSKHRRSQSENNLLNEYECYDKCVKKLMIKAVTEIKEAARVLY